MLSIYLTTVLLVATYRCSSAATIAFQATPNSIYPVLTKSVKLRCAVDKDFLVDQTLRIIYKRQANDWEAGDATSTLPPQTTPTPPSQANVSHIMSIIISKRDKTAGTLETVATVSPYDPPTPYIDPDSITVEGNTNSSPISRELGYLEASWEYPAEAQSGDYICDIYALDSALLPVKLKASARITAANATANELAGFVAQNQRYIAELQRSLSETNSQLSVLRLENQAQIEALNNVTEELLNKTEHLKAQNIQTGTIVCPSESYYVEFQTPYTSEPDVFISIFDFQQSYSTFSFAVNIQNTNSTGFTATCTLSNIITRTVKWIAIDN